MRSSMHIPKIIAHRGNCSLFPQNTLGAAQSALQALADFCEVDVYLSKDFVPMVFHDQYLSRLIDQSQLKNFTPNERDGRTEIWIDQLQANELQKLLVQQVQGRNRPECKLGAESVGILRLKKLLQFLGQEWLTKRQMGLLLQIKEHQTAKELNKILIQQIRDCIMSADLPRDMPLIVQSFSLQMLSAFDPAFKRYLLLQEKDRIPSAEQLTRMGFQGIGLQVSYFNNKAKGMQLVSKLKQKNLGTFVWTIRDDSSLPLGCQTPREVYRKLFDFQVDGIITEFPSQARKYISEE